MDILDSQVHLGPGGAAEMVKAMDALGIASVLVDEWWMGTPGHPYYPVGEGGRAIRTTSPTTELACWQYPGRFAFLVRADRRDPDLRAVLKFWRDNPNVKALRTSPGMSRAEIAAFAAGEEDPIFACAAEFGLPIFVQISGNTELVARYAAKFPSVKIIICHTGMPPGPVLATIFGQMEGLPDSADTGPGSAPSRATRPGPKCCARPTAPMSRSNGRTQARCSTPAATPTPSARPYLKQAIAAFGAERIMWASDVSANQTGESWAELIFAIRENPELSEREKAQILGVTAREWLGWPAA